MRAESIADLAPQRSRRDQTLGVSDIGFKSIDEFICALGSCGSDRIGPVGTALQFSCYWDGVDLLLEFSRAIVLPSRRNPEVRAR